MFNHIMGSKHSQVCKTCPKITFVYKESIFNQIVNIKKEKWNYKMEDEHFIEILPFLTSMIYTFTELILCFQVLYLQLCCTILLKF